MPDSCAASAMVAALLGPECYPHTATSIEVVETHISWVFLAGPHAYKVKKPVNLGFVDFSTLDARLHYCEEELRLNRRFAPDLYLNVVEIRGSAEAPRIAGSGPILDYAVRMHRFPQEALANSLLARGELTSQLVTDFATYLAEFHHSLPPLHSAEPYGTPEAVLHNANQNFHQISSLLTEPQDAQALEALRSWNEREFSARSFVCCLLATGVAAERQKSVGGIVVNIGVVPTSKAFQFEAERSIHGKTLPSGAQHLTVSLSDAKTGAHIAAADVSAEIKDPKGKIQKKNLLPASTAGAADYSEVFSFGWSGMYKIRLTIASKGSKKPLKTTFTWIHAIE